MAHFKLQNYRLIQKTLSRGIKPPLLFVLRLVFIHDLSGIMYFSFRVLFGGSNLNYIIPLTVILLKKCYIFNKDKIKLI